ncbi:MAG TPA: ATP-binding protein, partial [Geobacteraceae bacterium]
GELDSMTRSLVQREEEIRELNRELEHKVRERTAELEEKNLLLVKAKEELVRAEKLAAIGELAAGVAHEINNPMAIIRGHAEILQMSIPPDASDREEVDTIVQQVGRVEKIVANLLRFARRERKQLGRGDVNLMIDDILRQAGHQVSLDGIVIRKCLSPDLPPIEGDPDQLRQVFTNLVLNAIQAMPEGGELCVTTRHAPGRGDDSGEEEPSAPAAGFIEVAVADTGAGIPPENLEQIFNPFFTTRASGTGLGLSVSYGIVKGHGGRITVTSAPGEGSTFRVTLPLVQGG